MKKKYPKEFKARVAMEAIKGEKTIAQISSEYEVHSNLIMQWRKRLKENVASIFIKKNNQEPDDKRLIENLYKQVGKSQMEIDWFKKSLDCKPRATATVH